MLKKDGRPGPEQGQAPPAPSRPAIGPQVLERAGLRSAVPPREGSLPPANRWPGEPATSGLPVQCCRDAVGAFLQHRWHDFSAEYKLLRVWGRLRGKQHNTLPERKTSSEGP